MDHQNSLNNEVPLQHDFSEELKDLIHNSSNNTKVQIQMIVVFMLVSLFSNLQNNSSNLLYMNPAFHCQGIDQKVTEEFACKRMDTCHIINFETVTAQLHLYCGQRTDQRVLIQTATGVGSWIGLIFATIISDRKGRKFGFILALLTISVGLIFQYIGINHRVTVLVVLSEAISGFAGKAIYFNFLILSTRFLKREVYQVVTLMWLITSGFTEMSIAILNQFFKSWRLLFGIYYLGYIIIIILSIWILHEDPIYYFDNGKYEECKYVFREIAKDNGENEEEIEAKITKIDSYIQAKRHSDFVHQREEYHFDYSQLLKWEIISNVLILGTLGCFYNMAGSSIDLSIQDMKLSYNENLFMVGASKIVGYILAIYIIRIEKERRRGFLISSFLCGVTGMLFGFRFCVENNIIQSLAIIVLRIGLCWNGNFYVRLKVDLFPEKYQATLIGVVEFFTNFGKTFSPMITHFSTENHLNPIFAINILHLTLGTLPIFLINQNKMKLQKLQKLEKASSDYTKNEVNNQ